MWIAAAVASLRPQGCRGGRDDRQGVQRKSWVWNLVNNTIFVLSSLQIRVFGLASDAAREAKWFLDQFSQLSI